VQEERLGASLQRRRDPEAAAPPPWRPAPLHPREWHPEGYEAAGSYTGGGLDYLKLMEKKSRVPADQPRWGQRPLRMQAVLRGQRCWM